MDESREHIDGSLSEALRAAMRERGLSARALYERMHSERNRATLYRLLNGSTTDPALSTFLDACRGLEMSPTELLIRAGLVEYRERAATPEDTRLREVFDEVRRLRPDLKDLAITEMEQLERAVKELARLAGAIEGEK